MTTAKEHAAMVAAGMSDDELLAAMRDVTTELDLRRAAGDEMEWRDQARFQRDLQKRK